MIRVEHADMLEVIPRLVAEGVVVDAVCTDPPYHLVAAHARAPSPMRDGTIARTIGGFMGQQWDGGDIAFRPGTWATVASIMRPGAFLVAFGGTRTHHRVWSAIEDAGFVIQDTIMWLFGSGFPKRRDMLKPAFEPICLAYKPGGKRTMSIDECRIPTSGDHFRNGPIIRRSSVSGDDRNGAAAGMFAPGQVGYPKQSDLGRWPANICHDGSDEVMAAFPESESTASSGSVRQPSVSIGTFQTKARSTSNPVTDGGSAARFFFSAKAGAQDRWGSRHPTVKPVDLIAWLVKLVTPPGGTFLDPFAGSGTAAVAALKTGRNAILIEREAQYVADIRERMAFYEGEGKHSAVVKNRSREQPDHGPLFNRRLYDPTADAIGSYNDAVRAIGERVRAGEPVPEFFLSKTAE
jgi:site-specific DNA-methyltransferase (adenine-specific)